MNTMNKVLNAIDKALTADPEPTGAGNPPHPPTPAEIAAARERGFTVGPVSDVPKEVLNPATFTRPTSIEDQLEGRSMWAPEGTFRKDNRAKHGTPAEIFREVGERAKLKAPAELVKLNTEAVALFEELNRFAAKPPSVLLAEHLDALGAEILAGRAAQVDGWSENELAAERGSKIAAYKKVLHQISIRAFDIMKPIYGKAIEASKAWLAAEIKEQRERFGKRGLPIEQPDELLRSIRAAQSVLETKLAEGAPKSYLGPASMTMNLFEL